MAKRKGKKSLFWACLLILAQFIVLIWIPSVHAQDISIEYDAGTDTLTYVGGNETNPITAWNLWNASYVNNWNVSDQLSSNSSYGIGFQNTTYIFTCKVKGGDGSTDTWFATEGETIIFTKGVYHTLYLFGGYTSTPKSHFRMGDLDTDGEAFNGSCLFFYESGGAHTTFFHSYNGDVKFYDSYIYSDESLGWSYGTDSNGGKIDIKRSKFDTNSNFYVYFALQVKDCKIDGLEIYRGLFEPMITPNYEWNDIYLLGDPAYHRIFMPSSGNPIIIDNLKISDKPSSLEFNIYNNANCTLLNPQVDWNKITFQNVDNEEQWWIRYSFQVNITDCAGNPIEDANITVCHYGTKFEQDFSVLTWANGSHPVQNLLYMKLNATGGSTPYFMNPYNINIEKEGYTTNNFNFTLSEKGLQCIALTLMDYPSIDYGFALDFDGVDDYVCVDHDASLNFGTGNFSLEAWAKVDPTSEGDQIIYKGDSGWNTLYTLGVNPITNPFFYFGVYEQGVGSPEVHSTTLANGEWHHIVGIRNGTTIKIYVDGNLEDTQEGVTENPDTSNNLFIGIDALEVAPLNGTIDEMRIYNRVLNETEILYSYNKGYGRYEPMNKNGLVAWHHFDEGFGTKLSDETANNNDGLLYGDTDEWVLGKIPIPAKHFFPYFGLGVLFALLISLVFALGLLAWKRK